MRQQDQHADRRQADPGPAGPGADLVQRHVVRVLVVAQIIGGLGAGATLSLDALLAAETSGSSAW
ncbi:MFS transporter, partial [Arthrobacter agilis]